MHRQRTIRALLSLGLTRFLVPIGVALSVIVATALGAVVSLGLAADPVGATTVDDEQAFVHLINGLRSSKGLGPLTVDVELKIEARSWTTTMAATDNLAHSPDMSRGITAPWTVLGENVGVHSAHNLSELFQAFVNSPAHYENLVDPRFQYVGVGVIHSENGKLWTTHRFMASLDPPVAPPPDPAPAPAPVTPQAAPAPAPPTTQPPATQPPITKPPATKPPVTKPPVPQSAPPANTQRPPSNDVTPPETAETAGDGFSSQPSSGPSEPADSTAGAEPDSMDAERSEIAERVQPDPETVEDVLNELVQAGI